MLLFCFCAVGLSQAQQTGEDGSIAASYNTENVSGPISLTYLGLDRNLVINSQNQTRLVSDSDYTFDSSSMPYQMGVNNAYVAPSDRQALVFNNPIRSTCNEENPSNGFENGVFSSPGGGSPQQSLAADITVPADTDFSLTTINANILIQGVFANGDMITSVDITVFGDDGTGKPDPANIIADFPGTVPDSQLYLATVFTSYDILDTTFELPATLLEGQAGATTTYWIRLYVTNSNGNTAGWESTTATSNGNLMAFSLDFGVTWNVDAAQDLVYDFIGECSPIGGPPADNDTCGTAFTVECGDTVVSDTLTNTDTGGNAAPDEWYSFTGTGSAEFVTISLCDGGTDYDSTLRVFSDCTLTNEIVDNDDFCGVQSELEFESDGTSTYYIMVEGWSTSSGNFSLAVSCIPVPQGPPNDLVENAISMSCGDIVAGTTILATEDSAVAPTCDTSVTAPGVWYVYDDTSGLVTDITITMCNGATGYDSKLSVYTGDITAPPLTCVTGNDDTCGLQSEVSFQSDGATTYYILVHGFGSGEGNFEIEMICELVPPPNDMIANSIDVDEVGFPYTDPSVVTLAATLEAGSPVGCDNAGARGVWYNFVAAADGTATATIVSPGFTGGTPDVSMGLGAAPTNVTMGLGASGDLSFTVNNGPLVGSYDVLAAAFGGEFTADLITGDTVLMIDDDTTGDPNDACDPLLNGGSLSGKIAIARRGACAFTDKVISAQNAGAIAVIVINNQGAPIVMGGANPDITIPALMIGTEDGEALLNSNLGFNTVTFYTAPNENAVETDLELVDWYQNQCLPGVTATIPTVAGQAYYVFVANHDGVTDIVIDGTNLGTEDNNTIEGFVYYPNPTQSTLNLRAQDNIESAVIYNMLGQKVFDQNVNATTSELNVSDLATGAYILQVSVNGQIGTYQILKK